MKFFALLAVAQAITISPENDFTSYPNKSLDGLQSGNYASIEPLARKTGYNMYTDSNNTGDGEPVVKEI